MIEAGKPSRAGAGPHRRRTEWYRLETTGTRCLRTSSTRNITHRSAAVKYSSDNVFDYIELTGDYSIYEVPVPRPWIGKSLIQLSVRTKYHISVMALRRGTQLDPLPRPDHVFQEDETMLILGANKDLNKFIQHK